MLQGFEYSHAGGKYAITLDTKLSQNGIYIYRKTRGEN